LELSILVPLCFPTQGLTETYYITGSNITNGGNTIDGGDTINVIDPLATGKHFVLAVAKNGN
jgi:hypothetical protein